MENRNFRLDTEWNIIHYPHKPNGFGILILGDERHFVDEQSSFWTQNEGKRKMLDDLKQAGYTIFYSNLYGKNWGSQEAVELAKRLCMHIRKSEILNDKFHVLAEGMGALTLLKLLKIETKFRSLVLLNPILSLGKHLEQEKEHKFFYKKLVKEIASAYDIHPDYVYEHFQQVEEDPRFPLETPIKIIHVLTGNRAYKQSSILKGYSEKWKEDQVDYNICYLVPEKKPQIGSQVLQFFGKHERFL